MTAAQCGAARFDEALTQPHPLLYCLAFGEGFFEFIFEGSVEIYVITCSHMQLRRFLRIVEICGECCVFDSVSPATATATSAG